MSIHAVFEKWHHLDHLLSDPDWVKLRDEAGNENILNHILLDCWQAIKTELRSERPGRRIKSTPLISWDECMWNFEGECNLVKDSGFHYDYDRYADDEDEHEFKPCKYRIEYFDFDDWFVENLEAVLV